MKYKRCLCCKQLGHTIEICPRDPNIRTLIDEGDIDGDCQRVERINKEIKKKFAETQVTTA